MLNKKGQILVLMILILTLVLVSTLVIVGGAQLYFQNSYYSLQAEQATALAEAGIDKAIASLNRTGGSYSGEVETSLGEGSYSVAITNQSAATKIIESTGFIPSKQNPKVKRTVKMIASKGVGAAFSYGVQVGDGGLNMSNNVTVNGSVYSNGNIVMDNNALITGDAYVAGGTFPTADQQIDCQDSNCADFIFGKNVGGENRLDVGQSFKPSTAAVINKVAIKLKKFGAPTNLTVRILGDNNGSPDKNNVLTSGILSASLVTGQYSFVEVTFTSSPTLTAQNTYWIMLDGSENNSNYWSWSADSAQGYTRGVAKWSPNWSTGNPTWNPISADLAFKTFMGGIVTSIRGVTPSTNALIYGDAHANNLKNLTITKGAYYQAIDNVTAGSLHPNSTDPVPQAMPLSEGNISSWKNLAASTATYTGNITNCPATLPAGKYEGSIQLPAYCTVTVDSPIWITGNFSLSNGDIVKLNTTFGASSGVIIVKDFATIDNNNKLQGSGTAGSYLILISDFNTKDDPEQRIAINITNGGNTGIVYSNLGSIKINNNNTLTEITGWKLILENNVIVNYDQGLASAFFTSGPTGSYSLVKGTYQVK